MKKRFLKMMVVVCSLVCLSASFTCSAAYVWDGATKVKLGDVKKDDVIDALDLVRIKKYIAGEQVEVTESASDINFDKQVDANDVDLLRLQLVGNDKYWSNVY